MTKLCPLKNCRAILEEIKDRSHCISLICPVCKRLKYKYYETKTSPFKEDVHWHIDESMEVGKEIKVDVLKDGKIVETVPVEKVVREWLQWRGKCSEQS